MKFADVKVGMVLRATTGHDFGRVRVTKVGKTWFEFRVSCAALLPPHRSRFALDGHVARAFAGEVDFEKAE